MSGTAIKEEQTQEDEIQEMEQNQITMDKVIKLDKQPVIQVVNCDTLHGRHLDNNDQFLYMIKDVKAWNKEVIDNQKLGKKISLPQFKNNLFSLLNTQLQEVVNTHSKNSQLQFLEQVSIWYQGQKNIIRSKQNIIQSKFELRQKREKDSNKNQKKILVQENLQLNEDGQLEGRTRHDNIDPAEDRVKNFQRKLPSSQQDRPTTSALSLSRPDTRATNIQNQLSEIRPGSNVTAIRGILSQNSQRPDTVGLQRPDTVGLTSAKEVTFVPTQRNVSTNWNYNSPFEFTNFGFRSENYKFAGKESEYSESTQIIKVDMVPSRKLFVNDKETQDAYENNPDWAKKREVRSTYINYQPMDSAEEIRLEEKWLKNRNASLSEKRQNEELIQHISEWAINKSIIEQEINKKIALQSEGSRFQQIGYVQEKPFFSKEITSRHFIKSAKLRPTRISNNFAENMQFLDSIKPKTAFVKEELDDESKKNLLKFKDMSDHDQSRFVHRACQENEDRYAQYQDYEQKIKKNKLEQLRKFKGTIINWNQENLDAVKSTEQFLMEKRKNDSISIFASKQYEGQSKHRPFSHLYKHFSQDQLQNEQLKEAKYLKNELTKQGLKCTFKVLQEALLSPTGFDKKSLSQIKLPNSSSNLLEDPKFNFVKKKGKKKQKMQ